MLHDLILQTRLAKSIDDSLFDLIFIVNEIVLTEAFESCLLDQLLARTITDTERVHSLLHVALACDESDNLLHIPHSSICEKVDVRSSAIGWNVSHIKDTLQRLENLSAAIISVKSLNLRHSLTQSIVVVWDASLVWEQEAEPRAIAADIEPATRRETVQEEHQSAFSKFDSIAVHGATPIDEEDVLVALLAFDFFV